MKKNNDDTMLYDDNEIESVQNYINDININAINCIVNNCQKITQQLQSTKTLTKQQCDIINKLQHITSYILNL